MRTLMIYSFFLSSHVTTQLLNKKYNKNYKENLKLYGFQEDHIQLSIIVMVVVSMTNTL